jgi:phosphate transport system permease protein
MSTLSILLALVGLSALSFVIARQRAAVFSKAGDYRSVHSRPGYHGWFSALAALLPALLLLIAWQFLAPAVIEPQVLANVPAADRPTTDLDRDVFMNEVRSLASGELAEAFNPAASAAAETFRALKSRYNTMVGGLAIALALMGGALAFGRIKPLFRARTQVERLVMAALMIASIVAIMTTLGIFLSLIFESMRFFNKVPALEFLTGTTWSPQTAIRVDQVGSSGSFGAVPLFWGTFFIALIAMIVAVPLGLMSAIYLTQYANSTLRRWLKPVLEILAGVPTVVYGFFAALTVAPMIRDFAAYLGVQDPSSESALAAGMVMGVMIIPFMSSMADDAITAVPASMKDGSLALGATPSETIRKVLLPAALPGIMGGFLLAFSRAIGETMIVVMAAGMAANLTINPIDSVTTVTTQIVALLTGDQEFDSAKTLSAFALGLVLFIATLALNVCALTVVKRYREAYD